MPELPRFIADFMLGRLARWLRLFGYDTLYCRHYDDRTLIRLSRQEGRILLTRDTGITTSKACGEHIFLRSEQIDAQVLEVAHALKKLQMATFPEHPRCSLCNGAVRMEERKALLDELPEHVLRHQSAFFRCSVCGKVYWYGSHAHGIISVRAAFLKEISSRCASLK